MKISRRLIFERTTERKFMARYNGIFFEIYPIWSCYCEFTDINETIKCIDENTISCEIRIIKSLEIQYSLNYSTKTLSDAKQLCQDMLNVMFEFDGGIKNEEY